MDGFSNPIMTQPLLYAEIGCCTAWVRLPYAYGIKRAQLLCHALIKFIGDVAYLSNNDEEIWPGPACDAF